MEALLETQLWKAMMKAAMEPRDGSGETLIIMERLQELLLSLSTLLQKLDRMLPAGDPPARAPQAHDGFFLVSSVLLVAFSLAGLVYFFFFRGGEGSRNGVWGEAKVPKQMRGEGLPTMSEHEWMFVSIATLLFVILTLGGFYYYYCFQAGCFGGGRQHLSPPVGSLGRKLRVV